VQQNYIREVDHDHCIMFLSNERFPSNAFEAADF